MPETTERHEFCQVAVSGEDWFAPADLMPSRRILERMWVETPQPAPNACVLAARKSLDKRFLEHGLVARTAAIWPMNAAQRAIPSEIDRLVSEIHEVIRESRAMGAVPINEDAGQMAIKFATLLPTSIPVPEVGVDPDGEISFDWLGPSGKMFSVSVDKKGRLAYAGRFGEKRKNSGVEQLSDICPPEIILGIKLVAI
ncbi:MAG TPA: hypothetical protein VJW94_10085 [Candidatus Acidoferrum sp.]|nr:hypothetical protein [Candidatus Acidoferrum sp.]